MGTQSKLTIYDALKYVDEMDVFSITEDVLSADKLIFTGVGKNSFVAAKTAAMFSSLSLPAFYLDATHMLHGDFGAISKDDIVVALSKSANTLELYNAIGYLHKNIPHKKVISINFNKNGKINEVSDEVVILPDVYEKDPWDIVPTTSILVLQYYLDKVAIEAAKVKNITLEMFKNNHPGGSIGGVFN